MDSGAKVKLVCSLEIMNRLAQSMGCGSRSKMGRRCKGVLHLRNRPHGRTSLIVSTNKDIEGNEYDITKIQKLHARFIEEGFASIEISQPPQNLMLRNCNPDELRQFLASIEDCKKFDGTAGLGHSSKVLKRSSLPNDDAASTKKEGQEGENLRKGRGSVKRPRSPELSRVEADKIKRYLSTSYKSLNVNSREKYPTEFSQMLEKIKISDIGLRKIDTRILKLKSLAVLDLSGNKLKTIDVLLKLESPLRSLRLAKNEIGDLQWDLFYHTTFRTLKHLDLSKNQLKHIPLSITELHGLEHVDVSDNQLLFLPYNWMDLKNLQILNVSHNKLTFLPAPIAALHLPKLDISGNSQLQMEETRDDYVGYSVVPTLFEMCSETAETLVRRKRLVLPALMPSIVRNYMKGCKYCMGCRRMTLRYKISKFPSRVGSLAVEVIRSPGAPTCDFKLILCYDCDTKGISPKLLVPS